MIDGVQQIPLDPHPDSRGVFTELFRLSWGIPVVPVQWNAVRSQANVLRGLHCHHIHSDYLTLVDGRASVCLHDLREGASTEPVFVQLDALLPSALVIPVGVAHGFYFHQPSIHIYAVSHNWNTEDELGCHWDEVGNWPCTNPLLSDRDKELGSLAQLTEDVQALLAHHPAPL